MPTLAEASAIFATMLKQWRTHRHCSQLELAQRAGTSQRHVSFLETGRANPSRGMVLALAHGLDVPLREQNTLLQSAGFSAAFKEGDLGADSHAIFREALQQTIDHQMPYPALVLDGQWNMVMANPATLKFFGLFVNPLEIFHRIGNPPDFQMVRLCLHEDGLAPFIVNWEALMGSFLGRARKALLANPKHPRLPVVIEEITEHPRAPKDWREIWSTDVHPAMQMELARGDDHYRFFTMLAHFGTPGDVTLDELSVELFYPADEQTKAKLMALSE